MMTTSGEILDMRIVHDWMGWRAYIRWRSWLGHVHRWNSLPTPTALEAELRLGEKLTELERDEDG